jgi:hypothetical protein
MCLINSALVGKRTLTTYLFIFNRLTLAFQTDMFSRNISKHLSTQTAQRPRGGKTSPTPRHKPELSHGLKSYIHPAVCLRHVHSQFQSMFST